MSLKKASLLDKAKEMGIKGLSKKTKPEIIHILQTAEGNAPCFKNIPDCAIQECMYRSECI
jgi:hypothetical protein